MLKLQFYVKHEYQPQQNSLTWTLDYSKKSDFNDSCGYWYVIPHPDNPQWTRVYYSVEVSMFEWVPTFVVNFMSKQALTEATGWVKKYSELQYNKQGSVLTGTDSKQQQQQQQQQKHQKWWSPTGKSLEEDEKTCASTDDECSMEFHHTKFVSHQVGVQRYVLLTAVVILLFYNVHLFFSQ